MCQGQGSTRVLGGLQAPGSTASIPLRGEGCLAGARSAQAGRRPSRGNDPRQDKVQAQHAACLLQRPSTQGCPERTLPKGCSRAPRCFCPSDVPRSFLLHPDQVPSPRVLPLLALPCLWARCAASWHLPADRGPAPILPGPVASAPVPSRPQHGGVPSQPPPHPSLPTPWCCAGLGPCQQLVGMGLSRAELCSLPHARRNLAFGAGQGVLPATGPLALLQAQAWGSLQCLPLPLLRPQMSRCRGPKAHPTPQTPAQAAPSPSSPMPTVLGTAAVPGAASPPPTHFNPTGSWLGSLLWG